MIYKNFQPFYVDKFHPNNFISSWTHMYWCTCNAMICLISESPAEERWMWRWLIHSMAVREYMHRYSILAWFRQTAPVLYRRENGAWRESKLAVVFYYSVLAEYIYNYWNSLGPSIYFFRTIVFSSKFIELMMGFDLRSNSIDIQISILLLGL